MTDKDIQKTFDAFIAWLKSTRDNIKVEVIECNHAEYECGVRVLEDGHMLIIGYGASQTKAMEDVLEDAIIDYDLTEVNTCKSIEALSVKLAVMGF